jgi:hypothetical protein
MLVHRQVDEQCGKRKKPWIPQLRGQAVYIVDSIPTETFSSSKEDFFNDSMKDRALQEILPSLFDIAEAHEDYVTQYELFEGSGNADPLKGKHVTWKRCPRPYRGQPNKRTRHSKAAKSARREEPISEDSGEETEVDDLISVPSTSFSSFQSLASSCDDDVKAKCERSPSPRLSTIPSSKVDMPPPNRTGCYPQATKAEPVITPHTLFDHSLIRLQPSDAPRMDGEPSRSLQMMHFSYGFGDPRLQAFPGTVGSLPTYTPTPFQYAPWSNNAPPTHHPNAPPLNGVMGNVHSTNSYQPMQVDDPQVEWQLPFGTPVYGTNYSIPSPQHSEYDMIMQSDFCHGLPTSLHD